MSEPGAVKYRAFLSYSHADMGVARRVHARLESFRIDKDLVGRVTERGPIPAALRPIFRDREDFSGGSSLNEATIAALDSSAALVVLCSTAAAGRPAVSEEVRLFRARHPDRLVIPVIIEGTYPENFSPALRFELDSDGTVTDRPITILGPDLRESGDGFELGLAKIVAPLLGLAPDDIFRRAERERRRQARLRNGIAAAIVALMFAGGFFFFRSQQQGATLAEVDALVARYSSANPEQAAGPGAKESLTAAITAIAEGAATDPRYAKALALLKAGKPAAAEPLLKAVAEDKAKRADRDAKDAAAAYRNLASIAAVSDHKRARKYYAEAARLDPSNVEGMYQNGVFQAEAGHLDAAASAYAHVLALTEQESSYWAYWAQLGRGDIETTRGHLAAALAIYRKAQAAAESRATSAPGNADWQSELGASYYRVGDVQVAQGDLTGALKSYRASLAIAERLAKSDPGNAEWQRDLARSYGKVGDMLNVRGNLTGALASYHEGFAIFERLSKSDPGNVSDQHDLAAFNDIIANVQKAQGDLTRAIASYRDGLAIDQRLARSDPGNASLEGALAASYEGIGDVEVAQGHLPEALASYRAELAIFERLAKSDPGNAEWQRDVAVSYRWIGVVLEAQGNLPAALRSYRDSLAIIERLPKSDPSNALWQELLATCYKKVGDVLKAQGNLAGALASYRDNLAIIERLATSDPGNVRGRGGQHDLLVSYNKIGDVLVAQGDLAGALGSYRGSLAIFERLAKSGPGNRGWQHDLAVTYAELAILYLKSGDNAQTLDALRHGQAIMMRLTKLSPDDAQWKHDLAAFDASIAALAK